MKFHIQMIFMLFLASILAIPSSLAIGISPACYGTGQYGDCVYETVNINAEEFPKYRYLIFNHDETPKAINVRVEGDLTDYVMVEPSKFSIGYFDKSKQHRGCHANEGCQEIFVTINTTNLVVGNYSSEVIASQLVSGEGAMSLSQEVGSKLLLEFVYVEKPLVDFKLLGNRLSGAFSVITEKVSSFEFIALVISVICLALGFSYISKIKKETESLKKKTSRMQYKMRKLKKDFENK